MSPILIAAFAFGPVAGILVTVLASFIQAFFLGGDGIYGFLMHVIATGILVTVASTLYRKFHTRTGAIIGLLLGTFAMGSRHDDRQPFHYSILYGGPH